MANAEMITDVYDIENDEMLYTCLDCGKLRTKGEGGTVFTVCDECWNYRLAKRAFGRSIIRNFGG